MRAADSDIPMIPDAAGQCNCNSDEARAWDTCNSDGARAVTCVGHRDSDGACTGGAV